MGNSAECPCVIWTATNTRWHRSVLVPLAFIQPKVLTIMPPSTTRLSQSNVPRRLCSPSENLKQFWCHYQIVTRLRWLIWRGRSEREIDCVYAPLGIRGTITATTEGRLFTTIDGRPDTPIGWWPFHAWSQNWFPVDFVREIGVYILVNLPNTNVAKSQRSTIIIGNERWDSL